MAESECLPGVDYYVVCFLDVLGQKQKLASFPRLPQTEGEVLKLKDAMEGAAKTILGFRDSFLALLRGIEDIEAAKDAAEELPDSEREWLDRYRDGKIGVERFSDSFIFYAPIRNKHGDATTLPLLSVLGGCCVAMMQALAGGVPIRGGVAIGPGLELEDGSFYGPGLADAYHLESEIAGYPRIVVADQVREFLKEGQEYSTHIGVAAGMRSVARRCRQMLCQDVDGCQIVDFLGEFMQAAFTPPGSKCPNFRKVREFVSSEAARFQQQGNSKLAMRYHLLNQYVESRLASWPA